MAGIYIHIPYCQQACHYCDFHFSTNTRESEELLNAIIKELASKGDYLAGETVNTIYFGGGTPSFILKEKELDAFFSAIVKHYSMGEAVEITLEANPEDLSSGGLDMLIVSGVNRLSIGVQSFDEEMLTRLNRIHTAVQASESVRRAADAGFENISIDLMYGLPNQSIANWQEQLQQALELPITHLSAYCLTVSPKTVFDLKLRKRQLDLPDEDTLLQQFATLLDYTSEKKFDQYEICSFSKSKKFRSQHNTGYWRNEPYIGVGPSAHSYNIRSRQWNIRSNQAYINKVQNSEIYYEQEDIDDIKRFNEIVLTSLRTSEGLNIDLLQRRFRKEFVQHFEQQSQEYIVSGHILRSADNYTLSIAGQLIADRIAMELFIDSNES